MNTSLPNPDGFLRPAPWINSCDTCKHQEDGRHYCLFHQVVIKNMDTVNCDQWESSRPDGFIDKIREAYQMTKPEPEKQELKPEYEISCGYFPQQGEVDLTFKRLEDGKLLGFTVKVSKMVGDDLSELIPPCVYHKANRRSESQDLTKKSLAELSGSLPDQVMIAQREEIDELKERLSELVEEIKKLYSWGRDHLRFLRARNHEEALRLTNLLADIPDLLQSLNLNTEEKK